MAGDWIKMTHALPEKPEVLAISSKTGLTRFEVVGRLFILWRWFDTNTIDGNAHGVTLVTLDECLFGYSNNAGFVSAVAATGWIGHDEQGIWVNSFDSHISESAKQRALTALRAAKHKGKDKSNAPSVTKSVPREEKRREEITPPTPKGEPVGFEEFWAAWPASVRKEAKGKCLEVWKKNRFERVAAEVIRHLDSLKTSTAWTKSGGEFIPAPLVYLNQRRWEGAEDCAPQGLQLIGGI